MKLITLKCQGYQSKRGIRGMLWVSNESIRNRIELFANVNEFCHELFTNLTNFFNLNFRWHHVHHNLRISGIQNDMRARTSFLIQS